MKALFSLVLLMPLLLCGQSSRWLDGQRNRISLGVSSFFPLPLHATRLSIERWQPTDNKDVHWGLGLGLSYVNEEERMGSGIRYRVGEWRFDNCLFMELTYTPALTFLYIHQQGAGDFLGRSRIEIPLGLVAIVGGAERLERISPIIENGSIIGERPIWHKEGPLLLRPCLGLNISYLFQVDTNWAIGWKTGFLGVLGVGADIRGSIFLEKRIF